MNKIIETFPSLDYSRGAFVLQAIVKTLRYVFTLFEGIKAEVVCVITILNCVRFSTPEMASGNISLDYFIPSMASNGLPGIKKLTNFHAVITYTFSTLSTKSFSSCQWHTQLLVCSSVVVNGTLSCWCAVQ